MSKLLAVLVMLFFLVSISAQNYVQVWGDEFNTPGLPDSTKWSYEKGKLRNNELQYYTVKRQENARIEDSVLIIENRKELFEGAAYTSASIISKGIGDWKYGKFEIRAKVPGGKGTWPAIWMMPTYSQYGGWPRSGELDIMEYIGVEPQNFYFTSHFEGINMSAGKHGSSGSGPQKVVRDPFNEFITFTVIWAPDKIEWWANDRKYHEYKKPADDYRVWPFDKEFFMILNLAYGGTWAGSAGVDDTKLPHKFLIDYVRVYQLQDSESPFELNIQPPVHGKVEVSPKLDFYPENTEVTLTAIPDSGYSFRAWTHLSGANPYKFIIGKNTMVTPVFYNQNELLSNGEFDKSFNPWSFYVQNSQNLSYTPSIVDSTFEINITKTTGTEWHLGFQQSGLSLKKAEYKLTFEAWAEQQKQLHITVSKNYADWGAHIVKNIGITSTRKKYEITLNMPVNDENVRLFFGIGRFSGKFYIDNISLTQIEPATENKEISLNVNSFSIYPNPAKGSFKINAPEFSAHKDLKLQILTLDGKIIYQTLLLQPETEIKLKQAKAGIYIVMLKSDNQFFTKKLIVN